MKISDEQELNKYKHRPIVRSFLSGINNDFISVVCAKYGNREVQYLFAINLHMNTIIHLVIVK